MCTPFTLNASLNRKVVSYPETLIKTNGMDFFTLTFHKYLPVYIHSCSWFLSSSKNLLIYEIGKNFSSLGTRPFY